MLTTQITILQALSFYFLFSLTTAAFLYAFFVFTDDEGDEL